MLHLVGQSPWLFELKEKRKPYLRSQEFKTNDIVIIGGGIAGVMSAYYILTLTNNNVVLLERNGIASGATGHNAGQIVSYFERPTAEIVEQYGATLAMEGQQDITSTWDLLEDIRAKNALKTPIYIFEGASGCTTVKEVLIHLENRFLRSPTPHQFEFCFIAEDCPFLHAIPGKYADLYTVVPRKVILDVLETNDSAYSVAFTSKKGCMNSAMFCEEIVSLLRKEYSSRFQISENAAVSTVVLQKTSADVMITHEETVTASRVILCTNGFKDIEIINKAGPPINTHYHESLRGKIGFMRAFTLIDDKKPTALSYYDTSDKPYFYLTRRPSTFSNDTRHNLIALGGPEYFIADKRVYKKDSPYPEEVINKIDEFIRSTRSTEYKAQFEHEFMWHGLMGYTRNGIRLIGPDTYNPVLLYNLGCNGVGILPSIFGGKKIALFLSNKVHKPSIFDPYI